MSRRAVILAMGCGLFCAAGCNRDPFPYDQISGTIRYADGQPIPFGRLVVTLIPQVAARDAMTHPRPAQAMVTPDGTFNVVTTINYGDGAIRGKHKVTIVAMDQNEMPSGAIPAIYASETTTPLEFDTSASPWEIRIDRP